MALGSYGINWRSLDNALGVLQGFWFERLGRHASRVQSMADQIPPLGCTNVCSLPCDRATCGGRSLRCAQVERSRMRAACFAKIAGVAVESWDPDLWQVHAVAMLKYHFGVEKVIPVPDEDGGDRGLDAYTVEGIGYQCYAPEGEPLTPSKRAALQKAKITTDLNKLRTFKDKLVLLLGDIKLNTWVLLSPEHKSAAVIEHCNAKAKEVMEWRLPFIGSPFRVQIHCTSTYAKAHAFISQTEQFQGDLERPPEPPVVGADFGAVQGELIDTMNAKLSKIPRLTDDATRRDHRAMLLAGQLGGDNLLDRWRSRTPDVATHFESMMEAARKEMIFMAAADAGAAEYYQELRHKLVERFSSSVTSAVNAEYLAYKCITDWLQQCPLDFEEAV